MPKYQIETDNGTYEIEADQEPTHDEALAAIASLNAPKPQADSAPPLPMGGAGGNWGPPPPASVKQFANSATNLGIRGGLPAAGQALGALGGPLAWASVPAFGAMGGIAGEALAQFREGTTPTMGQIANAAIVGAIPGASLAKASLPTLAKTALKFGSGQVLAETAKTGLDENRIPTPDEVAKQFTIGGLSAAALHAIDGGRLAARELDNMGNAAPRNATLLAAHEKGLLLDPELANPTAANKMITRLAGESQLQKAANAHNAARVIPLIQEELGIPSGTGLTRKVLDDKAKEFAKPYAELASISPQTKDVLEQWQTANADAKDYWKAYRTTSPLPETRKLAIKASEDAEAAQDLLVDEAKKVAKPGLIRDLQEARIKLAQLHAVESATNFADGSVDPRIIGDIQDATRGSLTGNLKVIGDFAKAMPQVMGSPTPVSKIARVSRSAAFGGAIGAGYMTGGIGGAAGGAVAGMAAPFVAKKAALTPTYQQFLGLPRYRTNTPDLSGSLARFMTAAGNRDEDQ